ncbi:uncharacterized protein LOC114292411 [Camellia sinensis]|uniref:uncharacterized protein LOC114292411 n=1 Tax=Camellia sinensis TaxID=4442 RepID=UPI001035FCAE|nr:uncharacterized protein LOC114292411 [Camellia sinensis]
MDILKVENQVQAHIAKTWLSFLERKFFRSNLNKFVGDLKEPLKADEWLEQMDDAGQWQKFVKVHIGVTWEAFVTVFQDKFLPPMTKEKLRDQFLKLKQLRTLVVEFEVAFTSLSRFVPELVETEEHRCIEFEERLRIRLLFKVIGSMIRDYGHLMESATYLEVVI